MSGALGLEEISIETMLLQMDRGQCIFLSFSEVEE